MCSPPHAKQYFSATLTSDASISFLIRRLCLRPGCMILVVGSGIHSGPFIGALVRSASALQPRSSPLQVAWTASLGTYVPSILALPPMYTCEQGVWRSYGLLHVNLHLLVSSQSWHSIVTIALPMPTPPFSRTVTSNKKSWFSIHSTRCSVPLALIFSIIAVISLQYII
jgi:hypothetical protein